MAFIRIRNAGQEREDEPVVAKKVFHKVVATHRDNYELARLKCKERIEKLHNANLMLQNNEKVLIKRYKTQLLYQTIGAFLVGGGLGWLIH